eukprot:TRINITY_DN570_c0_g1_i2.p1 TRINITY_DN570_c0_g1~~TRINITY_DN570_c0_g1_i2.p1  ORF type:complete len:583 (+),score=219.79 TRINITY_DN570_c0_g1_i2:1335-3083(+)
MGMYAAAVLFAASFGLGLPILSLYFYFKVLPTAGITQIKLFGPLMTGLKMNRMWFSSVVILRKLLSAVIIATMQNHPVIQTFCLLGVTAVEAIILFVTLPMNVPTLMGLEMLSALVRIAILSLILAMFPGSPVREEAALFGVGIQVLLIVSYILIMMGGTVRLVLKLVQIRASIQTFKSQLMVAEEARRKARLRRIIQAKIIRRHRMVQALTSMRGKQKGEEKTDPLDGWRLTGAPLMKTDSMHLGMVKKKSKKERLFGFLKSKGRSGSFFGKKSASVAPEANEESDEEGVIAELLGDLDGFDMDMDMDGYDSEIGDEEEGGRLPKLQAIQPMTPRTERKHVVREHRRQRRKTTLGFLNRLSELSAHDPEHNGERIEGTWSRHRKISGLHLEEDEEKQLQENAASLARFIESTEFEDEVTFVDGEDGKVAQRSADLEDVDETLTMISTHGGKGLSKMHHDESNLDLANGIDFGLGPTLPKLPALKMVRDVDGGEEEEEEVDEETGEKNKSKKKEKERNVVDSLAVPFGAMTIDIGTTAGMARGSFASDEGFGFEDELELGEGGFEAPEDVNASIMENFLDFF